MSQWELPRQTELTWNIPESQSPCEKNKLNEKAAYCLTSTSKEKREGMHTFTLIARVFLRAMVSSLVINLGMVRRIVGLVIRMMGRIVPRIPIGIVAVVASYKNKKVHGYE